MNEKTFNPIELLKETAQKTTQATHELRGLIQGIEREKQVIEQKRSEFLKDLDIKATAISKDLGKIGHKTAEQLKGIGTEIIKENNAEFKKLVETYERQNKVQDSQIKGFKKWRGIQIYFMFFSTLFVLVSFGCAILFYKYSVQSKQDVLTEYQYQLERSNKVIVDKSLQDQIGYVNEWIEANPKDGNSLVEYVSKKNSGKE